MGFPARLSIFACPRSRCPAAGRVRPVRVGCPPPPASPLDKGLVRGQPFAMNAPAAAPPIQGLRTAIYHAPDLARARDWYASVLGFAPYFDEPFYVGFNVGGFELGLDPDPAGTPGGDAGVVVYWGVGDAAAARERLLALGATPRTEVQEVGGGIRVATVCDPFGNIFGVIENPHFQLPTAQT